MQVRASLVGEIIRIAIGSILANKLRTVLTLLGIIIGVASVIIVGAGISGAQKFVTDSVAQVLGSNSFILTQFGRFGNVSQDEWEKMIKRNQRLLIEDVGFVKAMCSACDEITAQVGGSHTAYREGREVFATSVNGVTANTIYLGNFDLESGRFFSTHEEKGSRFVAVIGQDLKDELFPNRDPLGQSFKIRNQPFRVVGVVEKLGSTFGQSQDRVAYVPVTTYRKMFGTRRSITIRGKAVSPERFEEALDQVRVAMRVRHQLSPSEDDDFGLISTADINDTVDQFAAVIASVVVPITLISLLVGGIVIMNIMLVSVTERTFEVGLRKALGARRTDILRQFLIEAFIMAALGGLIGLGLAWLLSLLVEQVWDFPMRVTWVYMVLAIGFSGGIGIIFGIYPAFKASRLDPIAAISAER